MFISPSFSDIAKDLADEMTMRPRLSLRKIFSVSVSRIGVLRSSLSEARKKFGHVIRFVQATGEALRVDWETHSGDS